jgi:hypothetical protein
VNKNVCKLNRGGGCLLGEGSFLAKVAALAALAVLSGLAHATEPGKLQIQELTKPGAAPVTQTLPTPSPLPKLSAWEIRLSDVTISRAIKRGGDQAGYQVVWSAPKDFPVAATATFTTDFQTAVRSVVESLAQTDSPVMAVYYMNNVLQIVRYTGQAVDLKGKN